MPKLGTNTHRGDTESTGWCPRQEPAAFPPGCLESPGAWVAWPGQSSPHKWGAHALLIHFSHKITPMQIHTTSAGGKLGHWAVIEHVQIKWTKPVNLNTPIKYQSLDLWYIDEIFQCQRCCNCAPRLSNLPQESAERGTVSISNYSQHTFTAALKSYCWTGLTYRPLLAYSPVTQCIHSVPWAQKSRRAPTTNRVASPKHNQPFEPWSIEVVGNKLCFLNFSSPCSKQRKHCRYISQPPLWGMLRMQS